MLPYANLRAHKPDRAASGMVLSYKRGVSDIKGRSHEFIQVKRIVKLDSRAYKMRKKL